jgi:acetylornithine deacetylase/succinyl-diaminopimelate desuccinylase-like protein
MAKFLHGASRMTVSPGFLTGGDKINIIPASASVDLDIRILPGQTPESVQEYLYWAIGSDRKHVKIEFLEYFPSGLSKTEGPLYKAIGECLEQKYPGTGIVPMFISSVTDARFWRQKGTTAYGFSVFSPALTLTEYSRCLHGVDERIDLPSLKDSVDFFTQLPESFSRCL